MPSPFPSREIIMASENYDCQENRVLAKSKIIIA